MISGTATSHSEEMQENLLKTLTNREFEVFQHMVRGDSMNENAYQSQDGLCIPRKYPQETGAIITFRANPAGS